MGLEGFEPPQSRTGTDHSGLTELQTLVVTAYLDLIPVYGQT